MRIWTVEEVNEHRAAYLAALRSGEYVQGKDVLTSRTLDGKEKDCCLGVACKVAIRDKVVERELSIFDVVYHAVKSERRTSGDGQILSDSSMDVLPHVVVRWLGLPHHERNPRIGDGSGDLDFPSEERTTAAILNDRLSKSFLQIADHFEEYFISVGVTLYDQHGEEVPQ